MIKNKKEFEMLKAFEVDIKNKDKIIFDIKLLAEVDIDYAHRTTGHY